MDIAIIGTGAVGGYYGARLAHAGRRVHFLLHTEYDAVKANGLAVDSCDGDFSIANPHIYKDIREMPPCDLVCVAVKTTANERIFPTLGPVLKDGGAILLLQNGFGYERRLAERYPAARIFAGLCFICAFREGAGHIRHTAYGKISIAPLRAEAETASAGKAGGGPAPEGKAGGAKLGNGPAPGLGLSELAALFESAGVKTEALGDLTLARWRKLVWNVPFNGLCVLTGRETDGIMGDPSLRALALSVMEEILDAGRACGIVIPHSFAEEMIALTDAMPPYAPSMLLDDRAGRPPEIEAIYANPAAYADAHGYDMKYTKMIRRQLEARARGKII